MNTKKEYISPDLKMIPVTVEQGFANSLLLYVLEYDAASDFDQSNQEKWGWNEGGDNGLGGSWGDNGWEN